MNNTQFRSLLGSGGEKPQNGSASSSSFKTPILGSRARSSIPMTPRNIAGYNSRNEFARQVAEQQLSGEPPAKKFKSSAAPKGTRLARGYQDRTRLRQGADDDEEIQDEKEKRVKALEEMMKLQQIDQATFDNLRAEIGVGGDASSTHLIKGLDWKLLDRVRRGEDINTQPEAAPTDIDAGDVDDELEAALEKDMESADRHDSQARGRPSVDTASQPSQVLSRDEILRRLRQSRKDGQPHSPVEAEAPLGEHFKKVDKPQKKRFTETINGRRREVLLTTDKAGNPKRKVRWLDKEATNVESTPEVKSQPLGMEVPAEIAARQKALQVQQQQEEDNDDDIFQGAGTDYDPLAGINDESDESTKSEEEPKSKEGPSIVESIATSKARNYFSRADDKHPESAGTSSSYEPTILAALKRAAALRQSGPAGDEGNVDADNRSSPHTEDPEKAAKQQRLLEKLRQQDREDARDLDMGFGESRFGDDDDEDGPIYDEAEGGKKSVRKRGPKKRKGDKDNVQDVMSVLEGRQKS